MIIVDIFRNHSQFGRPAGMHYFSGRRCFRVISKYVQWKWSFACILRDLPTFLQLSTTETRWTFVPESQVVFLPPCNQLQEQMSVELSPLLPYPL